MSVRKLIRLVSQRLAAEGYEVEVVRQTGHIKLIAKKEGQEFPVSMSCTPKNLDYTVNNVLADVRRLASGRYGSK